AAARRGGAALLLRPRRARALVGAAIARRSRAGLWRLGASTASLTHRSALHFDKVRFDPILLYSSSQVACRMSQSSATCDLRHEIKTVKCPRTLSFLDIRYLPASGWRTRSLLRTSLMPAISSLSHKCLPSGAETHTVYGREERHASARLSAYLHGRSICGTIIS